MIIFNFIGLAFVGLGCAVSLGAWLLFSAQMGDTVQSLQTATLIGLWTTSLLDLRYRYLGETPTAEPAPDSPPAPPGGVTGLVGGLFQLLWNLLWPYAGGHLLFVPVWLPAPILSLLAALSSAPTESI